MLAGIKKIKDKFFGEIDDPGPDLDFALDFLSKNASDRNSEMETFIDNMILMIERKPRKAIPILTNRIKSQPDEMILWKLLFLAKRAFGDIEGKWEVVSDALQKFPNSLFMKVQLGIQLLENDKAGEIPLLFNNTFNLKKLSKNFDIIDDEDIFLFWRLICYYYLDIQKVDLAYNYYLALLEVDCTDEPLDIFFETIQEEALSQSEKDLGYEKMSDEDFTDFALDSIMIDYDPKPVRYPGTEKLLQNLLKTLQKNPSKALPELKDLIVKYPLEPILYNYLYIAYTQLGEEENSEQVVLEIKKIFPDYLFGKIIYANYLLKKGRINEVLKIFNNEDVISRAFPGRINFHFSEVIAFLELMGRYYIATEGFEKALQFYKRLLKLKPDEKEFEEKIKSLKILTRLEHKMSF